MAYIITVAETAKALGVTSSRVYQLIEQGTIAAERIGRTWLVDDVSVRERAEHPVSAGRPKAQQTSSQTTFSLMNRTHPVLEFHYDEEGGSFGEVVSIDDPRRAPLGIVSARGTKASTKALRYWWAHRAIPATRAGLDARLRELGIDDPSRLLGIVSARGTKASTKALRYWWAHRAIPATRAGLDARLRELGIDDPSRLPFKSLGLSLSDQYWVRPKDSSIRWEDVNYFHNGFDLEGDSWLSGVGLRSPDNTSEGELPKRWVLEDGRRVLLKGAGPLGQEPYNEAAATSLFRRLLPTESYVPYEVRLGDAGPVSACRCFLRDDEEYIPAYYVRQIARQPNHHSDYRHMVECLTRLGVSDAEARLSQMIVCDDILGNFDRHYRNFGVVRNVETLECRMAPLFDSGSCLWCNAPTDALLRGSWKFSTKPFHEDANHQLRLVDDYSWFDPAVLEGFVDEVVAILGENPVLADRLGAVAEAVQWRIGRILAVL